MKETICLLYVWGSITYFTQTNLFPPPESESIVIRQILENYIEQVTKIITTAKISSVSN